MGISQRSTPPTPSKPGNSREMIKILVLLLALAAGTEAIRPGGFYRHAPAKASFCQGCRSMVSYLTSFNQTEHKEAYKDVFRNYCELFYPVSTDYQQGPCPVYVESVFYLIGLIDPVHHCDQIGACGLTPFDVPQPASQLSFLSRLGNPVCDICEQVVEQVQTMIEDPKFLDDLHRQVDSLCDYLRVIDQDHICRQVIDKNLDQAIDFIRDIKPKKYCSSIHLCQADQAKSEQSLPSLADFSDFGIETSVDIGGRRVKELSGKPVGSARGPTCTLCKTMVKEMFKFLRNNRTEENVRDGLDKICGVVFGPGPKLDECDQMVAAYTKELIDLLTQETDPELVCILLEQCSYRAEEPNRSSPLPPPQQQPKSEPEEPTGPLTVGEFISMLDPSVEQGSIKTCIECKLFIKYLQETLQDHQSVEEVKQWLLTNLCGNMEKGNMQRSCMQLVNSYTDVFFKAIAKEVNPETTCLELGACHHKMAKFFGSLHSTVASVATTTTTTLAPKEPTRRANKPKSAICDQCVEIVAQIDEYLSTHPIDHDVSTLIDQVCNRIPQDSIKGECTLLVRTFGEDIAQAIANMQSPKQLCSQIMLC